MESKMTEGKPFSLLLKFVIPVFLGFVFQQFYNMVDTVIVGHYVGDTAMAAVGSTGTIMFMIIGLANGLAAGYTVLVGQRYGAGDMEGTKKAFVNAVLLGIISTAVITVVSLAVMHPLLTVMNTPADIYDDAYAYISTICAGSIAIIAYNLLASSLRAVGNSRTPLYFLIFSTVLNIILDFVLIIGLNLGTMGAALATDISQGISAILCMIYIMKKVDAFKTVAKDWKLRKEYTKQQLNIGVPMALQFAITASGTMVMQASINLYGSTAVGGVTAAGKVVNLMTAGLQALGQTMAAYVGQNYGYGDLERVNRGTWDAMLIGGTYSIINAVLSVVLLPLMLRLFFKADVDISVYLPYARAYVLECVPFYLPLTAIFVYRNSIQACGYGKTAMTLGIVELGARYATATLSMRMHSFRLAVAGDGAAWFVTGIVSFVLFWLVMRRLTAKQAARTAAET